MGKFIVFEGVDGAGKTTIINALKKRIQNDIFWNDKKFIYTREPGGEGLKQAEKIRSLILKQKLDWHIYSEIYLFAASRAEHFAKVIKPSIDAGVSVISDRFVLSSMVYQSALTNNKNTKIKPSTILKINSFAFEERFPDLTFYIKIKEKTRIIRKIQRNSKRDRIERQIDENIHVQAINPLISTYNHITSSKTKSGYKGKIVTINSDNLTIEQTVEEVYKEIKELFK